MFDGNRDIDMGLSDINMPRMGTGLSLLGKLQESDENVSTVIVSAYGDMVNIRTAMNRGTFDFVTKPIDFADIEMTIAKTIRHVGILREARRRQFAAERAHASLSRYFSPNLTERLASGAPDDRPWRTAPRNRDALHRHHWACDEFARLGTVTYLRSFAMMEAGDPGSISAFAGLVGSGDRDELASFHLKRLLNGATGTRIAMD